MPQLSISLLGPFQVTLDGEPVTTFDSDKGRALLAYLAMEADRPHRRESLAGLLWPDWPERSARKNLSNALYNLRQVIRDQDASPRAWWTSRCWSGLFFPRLSSGQAPSVRSGHLSPRQVHLGLREVHATRCTNCCASMQPKSWLPRKSWPRGRMAVTVRVTGTRPITPPPWRVGRRTSKAPATARPRTR